MYSLIFKTIVLLGPFLKRAIFGDRSIKETLSENKQITMFFIVILFLCYVLFNSIREPVAICPKVEVLRNRPAVQDELLERKSDLNSWLF